MDNHDSFVTTNNIDILRAEKTRMHVQLALINKQILFAKDEQGRYNRNLNPIRLEIASLQWQLQLRKQEIQMWKSECHRILQLHEHCCGTNV